MGDLTIKLSRLTRSRSANANLREETITALRVHAGLMITAAVRILGGMDDAQDAGQDIAERLPRLPPDNVRHWPAYLKTLTVNRALDILRRKRLSPPEEAPALNGEPDQVLQATQRADQLRAAIAELSERDAALFSMRFLADLSHREIGEQLEMSENAVGVALHRIRKRLATQVTTPARDGDSQ
jgi:RNA polymerase sigma-70 factor (ECF subfamily)